MLTYYKKTTEKGPYVQVDEADSAAGTLLYASNLTNDEAKEVAEKFSLAGHLLCDVFDIHELPRIEVTDGVQYVFLRNPEMNGNKLVARPVLFVIKDDFFACLSARRPVPDELTMPPVGEQKQTPQKLLIAGIGAIVQSYEKFMDATDNRIARTEKRMRSHEATNHDFFGFVNIEGNLNRSRMSLSGLLAVTERLTQMTTNKKDHESLDDIRLFVKQLLVEIESLTHGIESIRNAYSTVANNTLNQRMKVLTALTLLMALPNVFYGMYGMNIALPFMHEPWAYTAIVGSSAVIVLAIYIAAKKMKFF